MSNAHEREPQYHGGPADPDEGTSGDAALLATPRKTRYRVKLHLDGANEATVTIERGTVHQLMTVRPLGKRTTYTLALADVAEMVAYKIAKNEAERKVRERASKKRR